MATLLPPLIVGNAFTVTVSVALLQPNVYETKAVPPATPVTTPVVEFTVTLPLEVDHVPPVLALLSVIVAFTHTGALPENDPGDGIIVLQLPIAPTA
jgi:hypothetical protein